MIDLWTDGSANPNPGPGGFAVILEKPNGEGEPVALGNEPNSTNIRMEARALMAALEYADSHRAEGACVIHTDSEFWINVLTKWAPGWRRRGWKKADGGEIKNLDLVTALDKLYRGTDAELTWTRGHVGTKMNELADRWANKARKGAKISEM